MTFVPWWSTWAVQRSRNFGCWEIGIWAITLRTFFPLQGSFIVTACIFDRFRSVPQFDVWALWWYFRPPWTTLSSTYWPFTSYFTLDQFGLHFFITFNRFSISPLHFITVFLFTQESFTDEIQLLLSPLFIEPFEMPFVFVFFLVNLESLLLDFLVFFVDEPFEFTGMVFEVSVLLCEFSEWFEDLLLWKDDQLSFWRAFFYLAVSSLILSSRSLSFLSNDFLSANSSFSFLAISIFSKPAEAVSCWVSWGSLASSSWGKISDCIFWAD